ncbi:zinc finger protein 687 [Mantella aurantiaca]
MGDMKTPDFDDLLAAFDIPDMDARDAIHSGPEDGEGQAKPAAGEAVSADHGLPHAGGDITAVSVIVKNTVCPEQADPLDLHEKDPPGIGPRLLHNGFSEVAQPAASNGGEGWASRAKAKPIDLFSDFAPVENPSDGHVSDLIDRPKERPAFQEPDPLPCPPPGDPPGKAAGARAIKEEPAEESPPVPEESPPDVSAPVAAWAETGAKASSPGEAPVKTPEVLEEPETRAPGVKEEPCWSPKSPGSDLEEEGGISSPSSNSSRPLKVRIKTIKTQSGGITRTVTAVPSDSAPASEESPPPEPGQDAKQDASPAVKSPSKAEASPAVKVPLGNGLKFPPGPILPVSTIQNASSVMLMAASVAQQKAVVMPPKASSKVVAKNIFHLVQQPLPTGLPLANISLTGQVTGTSTVTTTSPQRSATVVMVQSQKPAPPVTGTVISRTQSSLVESFNKILNSKNLLPTYKPNLTPPADASLALPAFGFRCLECGDSFALEKSLARHYDRRSMRIEVTCNHCTKRLVFFNKCSLLLHARKHKDNGLVMQCSHLVMRPIALEQMIGQPDVTPLVSVALLTPGKASTPGPAQEAANAAAVPAAPAESPTGDPALLPEQSNYSTFRCLECKEQCKNKAGLAQHFQQAPPTATNGSTVCSLCPMMMANRCSFEAHQRMHKQAPPNVCPECGGNFRMENFETHLKETCLHFSRRIGYRCQSCALVFGGVNSIKSHIQTAHCEVFHKCPICPMAFKSAPSAHAHIFTQHPGFSNQQAKMIYKCAALRKRKLSSEDSGSEEAEKSQPAPPPKPKRGFQCRACGYKTPSLSDFRHHIPQHCTDETSHQCRECGMCFTSPSSLSRHRVMTHKMKGAAPEEEEEEPPETAHHKETADGKLVCQVCNKTFDSRLNLNTHFRTHGMAFIKLRQSATADN